MKRIMCAFVLLFAVVPTLAAPVIVLSEPERAVYEKLYTEYPAPAPVLKGPAKGIQWAIDNVVTADGWSLTGYSSAKLGEDYRPVSRWKFGFIAGESAASESCTRVGMGIVADEQWERHRRTNLEDYISLEVERPVFGFHYVREF